MENKMGTKEFEWFHNLRYHLLRGPVIVSKADLLKHFDGVEDVDKACYYLSKVMPRYVDYYPSLRLDGRVKLEMEAAKPC